jgi:hypothetical protein
MSPFTAQTRRGWVPAFAQGCPGKKNLARGDAEKKRHLDQHKTLVFGTTVDEVFGARCAQRGFFWTFAVPWRSSRATDSPREKSF